MCVDNNQLRKNLQRHDALVELEAFIKTGATKDRLWFLIHATKLRKLLKPFDETIDERRCYNERRAPETPYGSCNQRGYIRRKLDRWNVAARKQKVECP